jgi:hypothetical protein
MWASVDAANVSGVALWGDSGLGYTTRVRPVGKLGTWAVERAGAKVEKTDELTAWRTALAHCDTVVVEVGRGASRNADASLGARRGYIRAVCEMLGTSYVELELSTWRRAIVDEMAERGEPLTWGRGDVTKAQAATLVRSLYGISPSGDECDAVLIGVAAKRLRLVTP